MSILELVLKSISDIKFNPKLKQPTIKVIPMELMDHLLFLDDSTVASLMMEARIKGYDFSSEREDTRAKDKVWELIKTSEREEDSIVFLFRFIALYNKPTVKPITEIFRALEIKDEVVYGV